ncbi:MAG: hypothetical protein KAI71_01200 [Candidatus Pacebacteria bacterium]|nr:hypothetical protein [Candidatus Paceibacterota bacterium]
MKISKGLLYTKRCIKQEIEWFIVGAKTIMVVSAEIDDVFVEVFNRSGIETKTFCCRDKTFPNIGIVMVDSKEALIVFGKLTIEPQNQYVFLEKIEGKELKALLLDLKVLFSLDCEFKG